MANNTREELYQRSSELVKELYSSENTGDILRSVAIKAHLDERSLYKIFALSVGDVILGLYKKTSLPQILKDRLGLTDDQVVPIIEELGILLDKIPESPSATDFTLIDQAVAESTPTVASVPEPINLSAPQPLTTVKPMRTFPDDFNAGRAHSYGAFRPEGEDNDPDEITHSTSQDDIIKK